MLCQISRQNIVAVMSITRRHICNGYPRVLITGHFYNTLNMRLNVLQPESL